MGSSYFSFSVFNYLTIFMIKNQPKKDFFENGYRFQFPDEIKAFTWYNRSSSLMEVFEWKI